MTGTFEDAEVEAASLPVIDPRETAVVADDGAEIAVCAAVLHAAGAVSEVRDILVASDFHNEARGAIYRATLDLADTGDSIDEQTVASWLTRRRLFERYGGWGWLTAFRTGTPAPEHVRSHAKTVAELAVARRVVEAARAIVADGLSSPDEPAKFVSRAARRISEAATFRDRGKVRVMYDVMTERAEVVKREREEALSRGLPTGFHTLDSVTGGLRLKKTTYVGAETSGGKSVFAWQVATHIASVLFNGMRCAVVYVSGEMDEDELCDRGVCAMAGVSELRMFAKERTPDEEDRIVAAQNRLASLPIFIYARIASLEDIRAALRDADRQLSSLGLASDPEKPLRVRLLVVDYIQMMRLPSADRHDISLGNFAGELKDMAKERDMHVLVPTQENTKQRRARADDTQTTQDLQHSTGMGQAADTVMFIRRKWLGMRGRPREERDPWKTHAEFRITKGRSHTAHAVIPMRFEGEFFRFVEPEPGEFDHLNDGAVVAPKPRRSRWEPRT